MFKYFQILYLLKGKIKCFYKLTIDRGIYLNIILINHSIIINVFENILLMIIKSII